MDVEISMKTLGKIFLKYFWIILLVAVLLMTASALYAHYFTTPVYSSTTSAMLLVEDLNTTKGNNLTTTINLMSTYAQCVKSDKTMECAAVLINDENYTPDRIRSMITVSYEQGGLILYIRATSSNAKNAAIIANKVREAAGATIDLASLTLMNEAKAPATSSSPSLLRNSLVSGLMGALLAYIVCVLTVICNTRIVSERQLADSLNVPVIGVVPLVDSPMDEKNKNQHVEGNVNE